MKRIIITSLLFMLPVVLLRAQVRILEEGNAVTLSNPVVSISFDKQNADLNKIIYKGKSLLNGKDQRGYLLGPGFSMFPSVFKVIRSTADLVELSFYHEASNHFQYDLRYILRANDPGIYCYLVQTHRAKDSTGNFGQTRWGIRSDEALFDYHLVRDSIQGPMPKMAELKEEIQDWTFKMADGRIYTKYNYADYIEGRYVHGMAGQQSGLGMFTIQASHEYLNGGPTKQFQNVHSNPYLINMFNCGHFLSDKRKGDNLITDDWTKLNGPFFLYFNEGKSTAAIWADAKKRAKEEISQWPYQWMQHKAYPLERGTVSGIVLSDGKPVANAMVILAAPDLDWQAQSRGYQYYTRSGPDGRFLLDKVRPGSYTLSMYGNNSTTDYRKDQVTVGDGMTTLLGKINWSISAAKNLLWQIGVADRKTTGFRLADRPRDYSLFKLPPENLKFFTGTQHDSDWYYAQTKRGSWDIHFNLERAYKDTATLTVGIAGSAKNPAWEVWLNERQLGVWQFGNDASVYRSAVAGGYYVKQEIRFPAGELREGENIISFRLSDVKDGGGIMYDVIKLEVSK